MPLAANRMGDRDTITSLKGYSNTSRCETIKQRSMSLWEVPKPFSDDPTMYRPQSMLTHHHLHFSSHSPGKCGLVNCPLGDVMVAFSALTLLVGRQEGLMPLPLTVFCSSKIQIGFIFLVPAYLGSPGKRAVKRVCVCECGWWCNGELVG